MSDALKIKVSVKKKAPVGGAQGPGIRKPPPPPSPGEEGSVNPVPVSGPGVSPGSGSVPANRTRVNTTNAAPSMVPPPQRMRGSVPTRAGPQGASRVPPPSSRVPRGVPSRTGQGNSPGASVAAAAATAAAAAAIAASKRNSGSGATPPVPSSAPPPSFDDQSDVFQSHEYEQEVYADELVEFEGGGEGDHLLMALPLPPPPSMNDYDTPYRPPPTDGIPVFSEKRLPPATGTAPPVIPSRPKGQTKPPVPEKPNVPEKPPVPEKPALPSKRATMSFGASAPNLASEFANETASATPPRKLEGKIESLVWPPSIYNQPDTSDNILFDEREESESSPKIKAATLEKLVEKLTSPAQDANFVKAFLLTYRSFTTPGELLDHLKNRFCQPLPEGNEASLDSFVKTKQRPILLKVFNVLKSWVSEHFYDFEDKSLLNNLLSFLSNTVKPVLGTAAASLETKIQKKLDGTEQESILKMETAPPNPIIPQKQPPFFLDLHPLEIARQMTLIEAEIFRKIIPQECLGQTWNKNAALAPNITPMIERFNDVSNWVVSEIVFATNKLRVQILSHFIDIADRCKQLNNLNGCMEILSGLGDSSVHRLKNVWSEIPRKQQDILESLRAIVSNDKNYFSLRSYLKTQVDGACIPYLGMYLTDLTFIEDGNKDYLGNLINFSKRRLISQVIADIQLYQQTPYNLKAVNGIQKVLKNLSYYSKEECYQKSLEILPRGVKGQSSSGLPNVTSGMQGGGGMQQPTPLSKGLSSALKRSGSGDAGSGLPSFSDDEWGEFEMAKNYAFNELDSEKNIRTGDDSRVTAGTIIKLVESLTHHRRYEAGFLDIFLLGFRSFCTPRQLLDLLKMRQNPPLPKDVQKREVYITSVASLIQTRVTNTLKSWADKYYDDFINEPELENYFIAIAQGTKNPVQIEKILKQKIKSKGEDVQVVQDRKPAPPTLPLEKAADPHSLKFTSFLPEESARQITISMYKLFVKVRSLELIEQSPLKHYKRFLRHEKTLKNWVTHEIKKQPSPDLTGRFIGLAKALFDIRNYHSFHGIGSALVSPEIKSLASAWSGLNPKLKESFDESVSPNIALVESYRQFTDFSSKLDRPGDPSVPYLPAFEMELKNISDQVSDFVEETLINVGKMRRMAEILQQIQVFQAKNPYNFRIDHWFQEELLVKEISKFADEAEEVASIENILAADPEQLRSIITSSLACDPEVRKEFITAIKTGILESGDIKELHSQVDLSKKNIKEEFAKLYSSYSKYTPQKIQLKLGEYVKSNYPSKKLQKWSVTDDSCSVYGWAEQIELEYFQDSSPTDNVIVFGKPALDKAELSSINRMKQFFDEANSAVSKSIVLTGSAPEVLIQLGSQLGIQIVVV